MDFVREAKFRVDLVGGRLGGNLLFGVRGVRPGESVELVVCRCSRCGRAVVVRDRLFQAACRVGLKLAVPVWVQCVFCFEFSREWSGGDVVSAES